jgi:hypothetical protein
MLSALARTLHLAPILYKDSKFARDGVPAYGWYNDLEEQNQYIHYAYQSVTRRSVAKNRGMPKTRASIPITTDKLEISYLEHAPWISRLRWGMESRWQDSKKWAEIYFAVFLAGIVLRIIGRRKQSDLAETTALR